MAPYTSNSLTAFSFDTPVWNTIPVTASPIPGGQGTAFTLPAGTYVIDYEMSLVPAVAVGLYTGATATSLALDTNSVAGSSTATTWIHGRTIEVVPTASTLVIAVSPVNATATVVLAGGAPQYMIRLTILKVA